MKTFPDLLLLFVKYYQNLYRVFFKICLQIYLWVWLTGL